MEEEIEQTAKTKSEHKQRRNTVRLFGGVLAVGLLITATYLGSRMVEPAAAAPREFRPVTLPARSAPAATAAAIPAPAVAPMPLSGNRYLQVSALPQSYIVPCSQRLRSLGFGVRVAPAPLPGVFRVMAGPFADAAALDRAEGELRQAGMETIHRRY